MSPHCDDEKKYGIVDKVVAHYKKHRTPMAAAIAGQKIRDLVTVNGVRVTLEDGTWGLVRASSNKPELVDRGREPGVGSQHEGHLRRHRRPAVASTRKSASTIRRSDSF